MKIDPTGKVLITPRTPELPKAQPAAPVPSTDQVEIKGATRPGATYERVPVGERSQAGSTPEVPMAQNARAQKLAEVRSRVEAGAYNSREMIEKVVDRLLSSWKLGSGTRPDADA
jgi:hypothetical protein